MRILIQSTALFILAISAFSLSAQENSKKVETVAVEQLLREAQEFRHDGKYEEGIDLAKKAQTRANAMNDPALEVEAIFQLSLLYYYQNDYSRARAEMKVGLARARVHELERLEADFLAAEGVLEWKQGNLHLALPKLQAAMVIREDKGDNISMASISNNIGIIYYTLKNYEDAEFYYRKGLELLGEEESDRLRSSLYSNLAEILIPMNRLIEAEEYLHKALEIEEQTKEPHSLAYTYFNLGELFSKKGESDSAIEFYEKAMELQIQVQDKWAIALTHLHTAEEFFNTGKFEQSKKEIELGLELVKDLNARSLLRDYSSHMVKLYTESGDEGRVQFYSDQHEWLENRIRLEESPPELEEPVPLGPIIEKRSDTISPIQSVIIVILATLIVILILENARLRNRMTNL